jgi:protein-S-isoprenylcysteine O-methyltransferase Ste14
MAAAGTNYKRSITTRVEPDAATHALVTSATGARGYKVTVVDHDTVLLTRRYVPTWAVVLGVATLIFMLLGLVAFLIKNTETVTVSVSATQEGTDVMASGVASAEMAERLNDVLEGLQSAP